MQDVVVTVFMIQGLVWIIFSSYKVLKLNMQDNLYFKL